MCIRDSAYAADAKVIHSHNYSGWQQFTRNFDLGVSHVQYLSLIHIYLIGNRAVPYQEFFARADRKKVQVFEDFGAGYTPVSYTHLDVYKRQSEGRYLFLQPGGE